MKKIIIFIIFLIIIFIIKIDNVHAVYFECVYSKEAGFAEWGRSVKIGFHDGKYELISVIYWGTIRGPKDDKKAKIVRVETGGNYISNGKCPPSINYRNRYINPSKDIVINDNDTKCSVPLTFSDYEAIAPVRLTCRYELEAEGHAIIIEYDNKKAYDKITSRLYRNFNGERDNVILQNHQINVQEKDFYKNGEIGGEAECPKGTLYVSTDPMDSHLFTVNTAAFNKENLDENKIKGDVIESEFVTRTIMISDRSSSSSIGDIPSGESRPIECKDFDDEEGNILKDIYLVIVIVAPILLMLLGALDFSKAVLSSDHDALKKAGQDFIKRVIATIILLLLPLFLQLVFGIFFPKEKIPDICVVDN